MLAKPVFPTEPRVVILATDDAAAIKVLELPPRVGVGAEFVHQGKSWRVTEQRPRSRVLHAEWVADLLEPRRS